MNGRREGRPFGREVFHRDDWDLFDAGVFPGLRLGFFFLFRQVPAILFLGIWIVLQAVEGGLSLTTPEAGGGIAFFAHIGGFAFGLLTAPLVRKRRSLEPTF